MKAIWIAALLLWPAAAFAAQQPEARREHLGHEQQQRGDEPDLPFVHDGEVSVRQGRW